jgi:hypothetical protein
LQKDVSWKKKKKKKNITKNKKKKVTQKPTSQSNNAYAHISILLQPNCGPAQASEVKQQSLALLESKEEATKKPRQQDLERTRTSLFQHPVASKLFSHCPSTTPVTIRKEKKKKKKKKKKTPAKPNPAHPAVFINLQYLTDLSARVWASVASGILLFPSSDVDFHGSHLARLFVRSTKYLYGR